MTFPRSLHWRPRKVFPVVKPIFYQQLLPMRESYQDVMPDLKQIVIALLQHEWWIATHDLCAGTPAWWNAIDSGLIEGGYFDLLRTPL